MRRLFIPLLAITACLFGCRDQYDPVVSPAQEVKTLKTFHGVVFQDNTDNISKMDLDGSNTGTIVASVTGESHALIGVGKDRLLYRNFVNINNQSGVKAGFYAIDLDGADPVLIRETLSDTGGKPHTTDAMVISRNGDKVAFITIGLEAADAGGPSNDSYVYLHVVDSRDPSQVTSVTRLNVDEVTNLQFSADGSHLTFLAYNAGLAMMTISTDGTGLRTVGTVPNGWWPAWSPDGSKIACSSGGHNGILLADAATGGQAVQSLPDQTQTYSISWYPDGSKVSFVLSGNDRGDLVQRIMTMDVASGQVAETVNLPEYYMESAQWLPDGASLLVGGVSKQTGGTKSDIGIFNVQTGKVTWLATGTSASALIPS